MNWLYYFNFFLAPKGLVSKPSRKIPQARKAAAILGYNYQSGDWYEKSYKVFYKKYKPKKIKKKKQKEMGLIRKKIKSLFE